MPRARILLAALAALAAAPRLAPDAAAQCMLANPSFEVSGSGGAVFGGWNQFGAFGSSTVAVHGTRAARVSGPNTGSWAVSGYWQQLDTAPGQQWSVAVRVAHRSARPLTGQSRAIVNVEWRNSSGGLISYESFTAADASAPADTFLAFSAVSPPAPAGAVAARLVLGVLQAPTDPVPDVLYDLATFDAITTPSLEAKQWLDFPGGRTLAFSGRTWRVKGPGYFGPGPNLFSDGTDAVWVDGAGRLHLTVRNVGGNWYSSEVALEEPLGYGDYVFTTRGRVDAFDPRIVLGMFLWQYGPCYDTAYLWWNPHNEIDVEFSRWGNPANPAGQFVAQPFDWAGNLSPIHASFSVDEVASHAFRWLPDRVEFRSWRGGPADEATSAPIHAWTYVGPHVPRPEQPRVHINLWRFEGVPAANQEAVLDAFTFTPACLEPPCGPVAVGPDAAPEALALAAWPNPFSGGTAVRFTAVRTGAADLAVFDLAGRRVRTLLDETVVPGVHETVWDGRDDAGRRLAAGIYFLRARMDGAAGARRVVLMR